MYITCAEFAHQFLFLFPLKRSKLSPVSPILSKQIHTFIQNTFAIIMSESISALERVWEEARNILIEAITKVVMEHGEDFHEHYDYYRDDFGIDEEETEENTKVLKIIDIYNHGGCCFPQAFIQHVIFPDKDKESRINWLSIAFWGLYVVEENGKLLLKYYLFYNEGMEYDSDISDPDHNYASNLSLHELEMLCGYLMAYVEQMGQLIL